MGPLGKRGLPERQKSNQSQDDLCARAVFGTWFPKPSGCGELIFIFINPFKISHVYIKYFELIRPTFAFSPRCMSGVCEVPKRESVSLELNDWESPYGC